MANQVNSVPNLRELVGDVLLKDIGTKLNKLTEIFSRSRRHEQVNAENVVSINDWNSLSLFVREDGMVDGFMKTIENEWLKLKPADVEAHQYLNANITAIFKDLMDTCCGAAGVMTMLDV